MTDDMINLDDLIHKIEGMLSPAGSLADHLSNYEHRPQQRDMAIAVAKAILHEHPLVVEAATGTGKTMAYVIPTLLSKRKAVVSTATKTLQDQLYHKDIPLIESLMPEPFMVVHAKGRSNYLCLDKYQEFLLEPRFRDLGDRQYLDMLIDWADATPTGDRAELSELPERFSTWADLSSTPDTCRGKRCPNYEECFVTRNRKQAKRADLVIVNHHLFFADLSLRDEELGQILPNYRCVVFDEAHHLEETATSYFGVTVSNYRIADLYHDCKRLLKKTGQGTHGTSDVLKSLVASSDIFFMLFQKAMGDGRTELRPFLEGTQHEMIAESHLAVQDNLSFLRAFLEGKKHLSDEYAGLCRRSNEIATELKGIVNMSYDDCAIFSDIRTPGVFLKAQPIDVAEILREKLHTQVKAAVYTSATLASGGRFDYFRSRLGLDDDYQVRELLLPHVFNYRKQALLFVPKQVPEPNEPTFLDEISKVIHALLLCANGRSFVLFTSYRNLQGVVTKLRDELPFKVLVQGERPRNTLLQTFREEIHSVLFATSSFWEGVDVQGESLSQVIIDKLPFAVPSDPVVGARIEALKKAQKNAFAEYQVPHAAISLRQGVGRLVRNRRDIGVLAILDKRILTKRYGHIFLKSLPDCPLVRNMSDVERWWSIHSNENLPG